MAVNIRGRLKRGNILYCRAVYTVQVTGLSDAYSQIIGNSEAAGTEIAPAWLLGETPASSQRLTKVAASLDSRV